MAWPYNAPMLASLSLEHEVKTGEAVFHLEGERDIAVPMDGSDLIFLPDKSSGHRKIMGAIGLSA